VNSAVQPRFILVTRKTRLEELVERFNTWPQARFYLEHNQVDASDYLDEHDTYRRQVAIAEGILKQQGRLQCLERSYLPNYHFNTDDVVVVIGQDGLVANTLKYLRGQPVIAINPDPGRWDGRLLPFQVDDLREVLIATLEKRMPSKQITLAEASLSDGQCLLAVNDLFIGPKTHTSARYTLNWRGHKEEQSSSGIIVSTGFGSTGWFQSVLAGAIGVTGQANHPMAQGFDWSADRLQFTVREPFPSKTTGVNLVFGEVTSRAPLKLESLMPENGVIFSDGIESDFLAFNSGSVVSIALGGIKGVLVVNQ
jgi:NAD kinase